MASIINASTSGAGGVITTADASGELQIQTAGVTRQTIDVNGNVSIGIQDLGTTTDTRTVKIVSNGYAVLNINGDYSNSSGEPGGAAVQLSVDGTGINAVFSYVNTAGIRGDSSDEYTGTTSNSLLVGSTFGNLHLGAENAVRATVTTAGLFQFDSGYGSVATAYGCRAWVRFNGTGTVAVNGSGNVSSVTDLGTGLYRINFSVSMPNTNYAATGNAVQSNDDQDGNYGDFITFYSYATGSVRISTLNDSSSTMSLTDMTLITAAIFR